MAHGFFPGIAKRAVMLASLFVAVLILSVSFLSSTEAQALCVNSRVASWDVLWIRKGPGSAYGKRRGIPAKACGVRRNGDCRGKWCQVVYKGTSGWTNVGYLNDLDGDDSEGRDDENYQCKRWSSKCNGGAEWAGEKYDQHNCGS